jgi:HEAT repeats
MISHELSFLIIITLLLFGALIILLMYLVARKTKDINKRRKIDSYKNKIDSTLFSLLTEGGDHEVISNVNEIEKMAIEELLSKYVKTLEGKEEKERISELATYWLSEYYRKRLRSKRWSQRMNALYHIEDFHITVLLEEVLKLTHKKRLTHEEMIHILRILASFQYNGFYELITSQYNHLSEFEYRGILLRLEQEQFHRFVIKFDSCSASLQTALFDVIALKKEIGYLTFSENVFFEKEGEVKLRALKALAEIGFVRSIGPYLELLNSSVWQERMVAAKLMGNIKEEKSIPGLIELLHDSSWWVRSQAGQSIMQFPNGKDILKSVLVTSKDAYAKDMAWDWLHKGV